jgi:hypothetical protein
MLEKMECEYCNKKICKSQMKRHNNTKGCREIQNMYIKREEEKIERSGEELNKNGKENIKWWVEVVSSTYKCKYCEMQFKRIDKRNEHASICTSKDMYYKLTNIINETRKDLEQKKMELELKDEIIKRKEEDINYFKLQLQINRPKPDIKLINSNNMNITINNTININFNEIRDHLEGFNIDILSDHTALINFIMNIFSNKVKLTNECKQIMSYYLNDKLINDIKCKTFLRNSAGRLVEISDKICKEGKNNKSLSDTIVKSACINNMLLNNISSEEGVKKGIRKKKPMILVHEIIRYLKENRLKEIRGV